MDSDASDHSAPADPWAERLAPRPARYRDTSAAPTGSQDPTAAPAAPVPPMPPSPAEPPTPASTGAVSGGPLLATSAASGASPGGPGGPVPPAGPGPLATPTPPARPQGGPPPVVPGPPAGDVEAAAADARRRRRSRWVIEWVVVLAVALGVAVGIRAFVVQTFYIPSASMEPTLMIGDRILVDKVSYHLHDVHRGDIVVFGRPPGERSSEDIKDLVKRVIGLPGETIWSTDGHVWVQGADTSNRPLELRERWLAPGTQLGQPIARYQIPSNDYYVLGDNRTNSQDSRYFGPIPHSLIVGRVVMRIWPLSHLKFF